MASIDNAAMVWSVAIVIIAVGFAIAGNFSEPVVVDRVIYSTPFVADKEESVKPSYMTPSQITVKTDKIMYLKDDIIKVSGMVDPVLPGVPVSLIVVSSDGNIIEISQMEVDDTRWFYETITTSGPLWSNAGEHTIKIRYGEPNTVQTSFEFITSTITDDASSIRINDTTNYFDYDITGGIIQDVKLDDNCLCMTISMDAQDDGVLTLHMPRELMDSKMSNDEDDIFFVLMDGEEISYQEINNTDSKRVIVIEFKQGTSDIEVIGRDQHWR